MITISLCMIVKNEEEVLADCLSSIQDIVDEMIIVDTGSTDQTKEIAHSFSAKVLDFEWVQHFAKARNFAFSHATKEYILWLDADDVLLEEDRQKLLQLKQTLDPSVDAVSMFYHVGFDEDGQVNFKYRRNRLVKRSLNFQWYVPFMSFFKCMETFSQPISPSHIKSARKQLLVSLGATCEFMKTCWQKERI